MFGEKRTKGHAVQERDLVFYLRKNVIKWHKRKPESI